jgi:hypothetical protein
LNGAGQAVYYEIAAIGKPLSTNPEPYTMSQTGRVFWLIPLAVGFVWNIPGAKAQEPSKDKPPKLDMSKAVACKKVEAYEKFEPLPDASLTSEDKLQVYYRPLEYKVEAVEKPKPGYRYRARFSQDVRIRKKGGKTILMKKDKIIEFDPAFEDPTERLYMVNNVGLKGLPPGDYELDIILRDELTPGSSATQTMAFTIIPTPKAVPEKPEGPTEPAGPASPKTGSKTSKKTKKTSSG